jgi:hypothetical protein
MEEIVTAAPPLSSEKESGQLPDHQSGRTASEPPPLGEEVRQSADRAEPANQQAVLSPEEEAELRRIKDLPRELGVMLMTVGVLGFVLPGVVGTPAVIAGGLVLWPKAFGRVESWFERKFPKIHKQSLYQINRYLNDLESRYPDAISGDQTAGS